jgi:hypothetical protein
MLTHRARRATTQSRQKTPSPKGSPGEAMLTYAEVEYTP